VQRLATELEGVAMPPETHFFDIFVPRALARGAPPWDADRLAAELAAWAALPQLAGLPVDLDAIARRCGDGCRSFSDLFVAIVDELVSDATTVGEKTPRHVLWWQPIAAALPEVRFVVVVRNPLDAVASNLAAPWAGGLVGPQWTRDVFVAAAEFWRNDQQHALRLLSALPERSLLVRYEDAVADPARTREQLAAFLGVAVPAQTPEPPDSPSYVLAQETWKDQVSGPIVTSRIGTGGADLGARRAAVVELLCRQEARAFGYRMPAWRVALGTAAFATLPVRTMRLRRGLRARIAIQAAERRAVRL
jgi:hypothetical protein